MHPAARVLLVHFHKWLGRDKETSGDNKKAAACHRSVQAPSLYFKLLLPSCTPSASPQRTCEAVDIGLQGGRHSQP
jgi:hypothetical protein